MTRLSTATILVLLCAAAGGPVRGVNAQAGSCFATTVSGDVQGVDRGASCAFLGVPFATPPIGSLRWQRPQPAQAWAPLTLNATVSPPASAPRFVA